jgi:hypothetical protein
MFKLIIGRSFEVEVHLGGVYLRIGSRNWYWSREEGFIASGLVR